jgi:hypothetical protein
MVRIEQKEGKTAVLSEPPKCPPEMSCMPKRKHIPQDNPSQNCISRYFLPDCMYWTKNSSNVPISCHVCLAVKIGCHQLGGGGAGEEWGQHCAR